MRSPIRVTRHSSQLVMLTQYRTINCFLVVDEQGVTLIDALSRGTGRAILAVIQQLKRPLKRVLITHAHWDHVGAVDEVLAATPDCEFLVSARAQRVLAGDLQPGPDEPRGKWIKAAYRRVAASPTATIQEGDMVGPLRVIETPGHTVEHVAYLDKRSATLIAGDCWQTLGGVAVVGDTRWRFPIPSWATWHRHTNLLSAKQTLAAGPRTLAVGHGRICSNAAEAMQQALDRAARRLA